MTEKRGSDTTVLTGGYSDFRDTVVDQAAGFDPSAFSGAGASSAGAMASQTTWDETVSLGVPAPSPSRASQTRPAALNPDPLRRPDSASSAPPVAWQGSASSRYAVPSAAPATMTAIVEPKDTTARVLIGVVVALVVVAVVAVVVALSLAFAPKDEPGASPASVPLVVSPSSSSSSSAGESAVVPETGASDAADLASDKISYKEGLGSSEIVGSGDGRVLSEKELYSLLSDYYEQASSYNKSILSCADDFYDYYLKEDKSVRASKASGASALKRRIESTQDDLQKIELPFMSKNTGAFDDICALYECLSCRIDDIDRAWKIDLTKEKPEEHKAEILEPITVNQVNGVSKYYTKFKELYPKVNLVKP